MAPLSSRPLALPRILALVTIGSVCKFSISFLCPPSTGHMLSFSVPQEAHVQGTQSRAIGWRGPSTGFHTKCNASPGAPVLYRGDASPQVPGAGSIALQAAAVLASIGSVMGATLGAKVTLQAIIGVVGLYVIMSVNEYAVHRYYQHIGINKTSAFRWLRAKFGLPPLKSTGHVEHHKETLDDMTLDQKPHPILDADPFRGTAFSWSVSAVMTFEIALQSYPWLWLCGWSVKASTIALLTALALHAAVWQTLHPNMHELPDPPISYGIPGWSLKWLRGTGYFRFLYANHEGHHRAPGAHGNYNVCCPLADHMFGTYVGVIPAKQLQVA